MLIFSANYLVVAMTDQMTDAAVKHCTFRGWRFGLTILKEAAVVDGDLVPLLGLLCLLAVRLQGHLHLGQVK